MSPIKGLTDRPRQLPRLGKIHLGIKVQGDKSSYPKATDYFVCPPEVQAIYGEKPTELDIAFPVDDIDVCASVWYRCYSSYRGLTCKGDGIAANRLVDMDKAADPKTGELPEDKSTKFWPIARKDTKTTKRMDITCDPEHCEEYGRKQCRMIMNLQFLLPNVEGIGIYQIDTSSIFSIKNVLDNLELIKRLGKGRMALIPLKLALIEKEVAPDGVKKTVHILQIYAPMKIAQLMQIAALPAGQALLPPGDMEAPEGLVPEDVQDGNSPLEGEGKPIIIEGHKIVNLEDDIFGPNAAEERDRQIVWKEILELVKEANQTAGTLITWFGKRHNIKVKEIADTPPEKATLAILTQLSDNLQAYKASIKKANPNQGKLV